MSQAQHFRPFLIVEVATLAPIVDGFLGLVSSQLFDNTLKVSLDGTVFAGAR